MLKKWIAVAAIGAVMAGSIAARAQNPSDRVHKIAPQFVLEDLAGRKVDLRQYRGKVVLLNFWATWCGPCRVELPAFQVWQKRYGGDGLQILAVSMDDSDAPVRRTVRKLHLEFPVVMGDAQLGEAYGGVLGLPVTFLIDREGRISRTVKGAADVTALESQVRGLLAQK